MLHAIRSSGVSYFENGEAGKPDMGILFPKRDFTVSKSGISSVEKVKIGELINIY